MPCFFFHLQDGGRWLEDNDGEEFPSAEAAERHARLVAWELAKNAGPGTKLGRVIVLTDDRARELLRVPLDGATEPR